MKRRFRFIYLIIGIAYCIILFMLYVIIGLNGWQGELGGCTPMNPCFCESITMDALIREKSQTWSNLGLVISGLLILFWIGKDDKLPSTQKYPNPMIGSTTYSVLYGFLTINIGIGSFWFHGSLMRYAEFMDTFAMNMYITFFLYYIIIRLTRAPKKLFLSLYIPTVTVLGICEWILHDGMISTFIFSTLAGICIIIESVSLFLMYQSKKYLKGIIRDWRWFVAGIGLFFFSFLIWYLSLPGKILCYPDTWIQGHSFWHIGVAMSTFFLYLYARSEVFTGKS